MESNSYGTLAEGTLLLKNGEWYIVPSEGDPLPVNGMLQKWEGRKVRVIIANLEILGSIMPGAEMKYVNDLTNDEIAERLKKR